jgi:hypothetical protein
MWLILFFVFDDFLAKVLLHFWALCLDTGAAKVVNTPCRALILLLDLGLFMYCSTLREQSSYAISGAYMKLFL